MVFYSRAFLLALCCAACAPALPESQIERALVRDLARVVQSREQISWFIDEIDVQEVLPDALDSACRVDPSRRQRALHWLDEELERLGGPVQEAYLAAGKDLDSIETLLLWHRTRLLLGEADRWAKDGKCPFWLEVEPEFRGVQGFSHKFLVAAETGGRFYTQWEDGKAGFGGGGAVRVLMGYGIDDEWTLFTGGEFGGAGRFSNIEVGERINVPAFLLIGAVPVILRRHDISNYYEVEAAAIGYFNQLRGGTQPGIRVGAGIGFMRVRLGGIVPGITASMNYDFIPGRDGAPTVHQVGAGLRGVFALTL